MVVHRGGDCERRGTSRLSAQMCRVGGGGWGAGGRWGWGVIYVLF